MGVYQILFQGKSRKDFSSDSEDEKRRRRREEKKKSKNGYTKGRHSSESELDEDAVAAYYAVRIDKSQGMTITAERTEGKYGDSSSESASAHNPRNLPILDAPAPAKGILKKVNSNLNLAKSDIMSEAGTASCVSTVGYITNKLAQRLKARGQHDVLDSPKRTESSSDDIWQQEKENWLRQKEELKAWAAAQGQAGHQVGSGRSMLCYWSRSHAPESCVLEEEVFWISYVQTAKGKSVLSGGGLQDTLCAGMLNA